MDNTLTVDERTIETLNQLRRQIDTRPALVRLLASDLRPYLGTIGTIARDMGERNTTVLNWAKHDDFPAPVLEFGPYQHIYCAQEVIDWITRRRGK